MYPLIAVKSFGKEKASEVIKELLKANGDLSMEPISMSMDSYDFTAVKLVIVTKYYTAPVLLFECNDLSVFPETVRNKIEGCIVYFDANDKLFLTEINSLVEFVNNNHIEVSTLVTRNLSENSLYGITYEEVKDRCHHSFSVIDLNSKNDDDEVIGFADVLELLKNHVWSTVKVPLQSSDEHRKPDDVDDENEENVEEVLNEFEDLLTKFQQFKDISRNLCREEVLQYAENLADLFENMLNEN